MKTELPENATPYERFLLKHRVFCEYQGCMKQGKCVREVNGHDTVLCWSHDPEFSESFSEWLEQQGDSLPEPQDFPEYLTRRGDSIIS